MKKSVAMKWAKALRSGKYKQTSERLQNSDGFCCLGVLCKLAEKENVHLVRTAGEIDGGTLNDQTEVGWWAGISEAGMLFAECRKDNERELMMLTEANDDLGLSFDEIADVIEMAWEDIT